MLYLTFGNDKKIGNNLKSFLDYYEDSKNPHFEIMHFPEFFKFLDRPLKQIKTLDDLVEMQNDIEEKFKAFLNQIEDKINVFITND